MNAPVNARAAIGPAAAAEANTGMSLEVEVDWPHQVAMPVVQRSVDALAALQLESGPREVWALWQRARLADALNQAVLSSSFWRDRLGLGLSEDKLRRWHALPTLSRAELAASIEPQPPRLSEFHGEPTLIETGGATGARLRLWSCAHTARMTRGHMHADHARHGRRLDVLRATITEDIPAHDGDQQPHIVLPGLPPLGEGPHLMRHIASSDPEGHARWLARTSPKLLTVPTPVLHGILDAFEAGLKHPNGKPIATPQIEFLATHGETISQALRQRALRVLGAQLRDRYLAAEVGAVAFQCPGRDGVRSADSDGYYHAAVSNVVLEVLGDDGQPVADGQSGHVHVTGLHHPATPVFRYSLGDRATWHHQCPACGATVPTLSGIGRSA